MINNTNGTKFRDRKVEEVLREMASKFILEESAGPSLITVTHVKVSGDLKNAKIYFTSLPTDSEKFALDFMKRKRSEFRDFLKEKSGLQRLPFIDFEIDLGERNRQLIDDLSNRG